MTRRKDVKRINRIEWLEACIDSIGLILEDKPESIHRYSNDILDYQIEYKQRTGHYYKSPYIPEHTNI